MSNVRGRLLASAAAVALGALLGPAVPATASLTLWPTCTSPPAGDYARCEHGAFPQSIIPGPDGAMWFTTARADLGRVTTAGGFAQVPVPVPVGSDGLLGGLTVGPDGALWFPSAYGAPYLYRATPTTPSVFTSTLNPGDTQPRDAVLGPDGAIWLGEAKSNTLGRFVPVGGSYTSFPLAPKPGGTFVGPLGVANGPDGRLWVARPEDLLAVTTAGVVTSYAIPGIKPDEVTAGPDGAMWVTSYASNKIARVTTSGVATVFPLPAASGPVSITTGPDGALWIGLGKGTSGIMRMTTSGSWTVTPLMFSSQVSSVTTGPDGAIWFADLGGSRVGRLTVGSSVAGPEVRSLGPSVGPVGTVIHVGGEGLTHATGVTVGGVKATFRPAGGGLDVTAPDGMGAAPVLVTVGTTRSFPTAASTFSFTTSAVPTPVSPPSVVAPTVVLGVASLAADGTLTVAVRVSEKAPFDLAVALPPSGTRARIAAAGSTRLVVPRVGSTTGRLVRTGTTHLRLRLSAAGRRAVSRAGVRGARVEVGVRLRLGGGQTTVGQRTYRLRAGG